MCPVLTEAFPSRIGLKKSPPGAKQNLCFHTLYGGVKFSSNSSLNDNFGINDCGTNQSVYCESMTINLVSVVVDRPCQIEKYINSLGHGCPYLLMHILLDKVGCSIREVNAELIEQETQNHLLPSVNFDSQLLGKPLLQEICHGISLHQ